MILRIFLISLFLWGTSMSICAQNDFPYEKYLPRTMGEIEELSVALQNSTPDANNPKTAGLIFDADFLYSHVRMKFMNKSRPVPAERKETLGFWQKTFSLDEKVIASYESEYLFRECAKDHWIPVQKPVSEYFPKELKEGDMVTLYLMRATGKRAKGSMTWDWIYLVSEFVK